MGGHLDLTDQASLKQFFSKITFEAISRISNPRYFKSERGYQGELYCVLRSLLDESCLFQEEFILEMEYQKNFTIQGTNQRPDIIFHIPTEISGVDTRENNLCVWALKLHASEKLAMEDFEKLDNMFNKLHYPVGIFININSNTCYLNNDCSAFPDRLVCFSIELDQTTLVIHQDEIIKGKIGRQTYRME